MINGKQIFDCFTFFNESELLLLRLMEYYDCVDYFVIVEATKSHTGKLHKPILSSLLKKSEYKIYCDKIVHIIVDDLPDYDIQHIWKAENFQRNAIQRGLDKFAKDGDLIFVSDCDELWNSEKIGEVINADRPMVFEQDLFYYWVNCKQNCKWLGTCCAPYGMMTPQEMRNYAQRNTPPVENIIKNGGWHYSYMGGTERIKEKVENIAESHLIIDKVGDKKEIEEKIDTLSDLWNRKEAYARKRIVMLKNKPKKLDDFLKIYPNFFSTKKPDKKNVEIITLIYCSVDYLQMIANELKKIEASDSEYFVGIRIIANDANKKVLEKLPSLHINYSIYKDKEANDYYINRVYRAYNFAVSTSEYDNVILINSDMIFSKDWLNNLLKYHDGINIPVSRLIESGKMPSGKYGVSKYFGSNPYTIKYKKWERWVKKNETNDIKPGGLYMPVIFSTERFLESRGYPEGNVYEDGTIGTQNGNVLKSGDRYFFEDILEKKYNMRHITIFNSLCYHIQEGERDEFLMRHWSYLNISIKKYTKKIMRKLIHLLIPNKTLRQKMKHLIKR
jgi:hypothetical protein